MAKNHTASVSLPVDLVIKKITKFGETHTTELMLLVLIGAYFLWDGMKGLPKIRGSAEWASKAEIARAHFLCKLQNIQKKPGKVSYILGNIPIFGAQTSMITFGKPETGKSLSVANYAIYEHLKAGGPAAIMDLQYPEQTQHFVALAIKFGYAPENIKLFVPGEDTSDIWNPCRDATGTKALTTGESVNANTKPVDAKIDGFFDPGCVSLLAGIFSYVRNVPELDGMLGCRAVAQLPDLVKRIAANKEYLFEVAGADAMNFDQFRSNLKSEKTAENIRATVLNAISGGSSVDIYPSMSGESNIPLVMDGKQLLILGCTQEHRSSVAPYLVALLEQIIVANTFHGRKTNLQVSIDELAAINIVKLRQYINENRKYGVYFNLATQTLKQLEERYGKTGASSIMTAAGFKAFFNPGDVEAAEYLQKTLGTYKWRETERSHGYSGGRASSNVSTPIRERPLMSAAEMLLMPQGTGIFLTRGASRKKAGSQQNSKEYIPFKRMVMPDPIYLKDMADSAREWKEHTEAALKRRSPLKPASLEAIRAAYALAEELLPLGASSDEKLVEDIIKKNNDTYKGMLDDL
jgi:TraM recognition site of TraD and TraG